jgi:hypothetical protein
MSADGTHAPTAPDTSERQPLDAYYTPQALSDALVTVLVRDGWWRGGRVLEPSGGQGAFIRSAFGVLAPELSYIATVEVDEDRARALGRIGSEFRPVDSLCTDFLQLDENTWDPFDLILGNPPYSDAEAHTRAALRMRERFGVVAFLLRMGFLESEERAPFWRKHPASKVYVLSQRPSFTGNGKTDRGQSYGWFVWATWHRGPTELEVLSWREPVRGKK